MSPDTFAMLGARPALGLPFDRRNEREGADPVVILGHGLWQRRFGADPDVIGRSVTLEGVDRSVVGVIPPRFAFPDAQTQFCGARAADAHQPKKNAGSHCLHQSLDGPRDGRRHPRANAGTVFVGQTADTPAFAVDCIEKCWRTEGRKHLQFDKPRRRKKRRRAAEPGEVEIPAYTALQADQRLADRMLELVLRGVSTRKYETVLPAMADQVGVSKSEVSRETIESGTRVLKELVERDLSELDVLVVYLDGIVFGDYHVLAAVGVDADGRKHVLGLCGGASENTEVTAGLLEDLVARGLQADRRRLFVIDGAKALRQAIGRVFGSSNLVQRCRNHKVRNVLGHLPKEQHEQARSTLRAAWKLDADEGIRKLEQYASWLEREWPSAAGSLREGLSELFTVNRLGLPKPLHRCLTTTNIIDSSHAGVRQHTNRVSRWQSEEMAVRWAAVTFRETEKHYRRITGYEHLWMLKAHLDEEDGVLAELQKAG